MYMNRKKVIWICGIAVFVAAVMVGILLMAVRPKAQADDNYAHYASTIEKEDCYLCANHPNSTITGYLGEKNIGFINLNTFDCYRLEVNRYDADKNPINKLVKYGQSDGNCGDKETSSHFSYEIYSNKGYARGTLYLNDNSDLQLDRIQTFLCSDCLTSVMGKYYSSKRHWDFALIDFEKGKIHPLSIPTIGQYLSDYYVHTNYNAERDSLDYIAYYCPDRYSELDYDPNLSITEEIQLYCEENGFAFTLNDEIIEFLQGLEKIGAIIHDDESVTFYNDYYWRTKALTIIKDGTYEITDFDD